MITARLVLGLLISITANTYADEPLQGDVNRGQAASATCQGCHGPDGNSYSPDWPNLASQNVSYLSKQIHDFQSGARKDPTMSSMVTGLAERDIADIVAFFSSQAVKADATSQSAAGQKLYMGGNRYTRVPACAGCHGPHGVGNGPGAIPHLAGQKTGYVAKALRDFKSGARSNDRNQIMRDIAEKLTEKEITALAQYLAGMGASAKAPAQ